MPYKSAPARVRGGRKKTDTKNGTEFRFQTDTKNRNGIPFSDGHKKSERNSVFSDGHKKRNGIPFSEIGIESDKVSGNNKGFSTKVVTDARTTPSAPAVKQKWNTTSVAEHHSRSGTPPQSPGTTAAVEHHMQSSDTIAGNIYRGSARTVSRTEQ